MFLDTTVLIELVRRTSDDPVRALLWEQLRGHPLFACSIQLGEVADYHRRESVPADAAMAFIRRLVDVVPVDEATALLASEIKGEARRHRAGKNFSLIDGVALAAARLRGQRLLTMAGDFAMFADAQRIQTGE